MVHSPRMSSLIELRFIPGKGHGYFATQNIVRGTKIIEEPPLLLVKPAIRSDQWQEFVEQLEKLEQRSSHDFDVFNGLYSDPGRTSVIDPDCDWACRYVATIDHLKERLETRDAIDPNAVKEEAEELSAKTRTAIAIFDTNCLQLNEDAGTGVFPSYSRLNHSCEPNVAWYYNRQSKRLAVRTVRHINASEELLTTYLSAPARLPRDQRCRLFKQGWGFYCTCNACAGPKAANHDDRRKRIFELDQKLGLYGVRGVPQGDRVNAEQALQMSEEILTFMREDGVKDSQLIKAYRDCSRFSVENGDSVKAVNYAEKELEVESFSIGERRTRSKDDFESAKNWLDTLKVLRGQQRY